VVPHGLTDAAHAGMGHRPFRQVAGARPSEPPRPGSRDGPCSGALSVQTVHHGPDPDSSGDRDGGGRAPTADAPALDRRIKATWLETFTILEALDFAYNCALPVASSH
jgi:hypothetical protein